MIDFGFLVVTTVFLFLFHRWIQKRMQGLVLLLGGSKKLAVYAYSFVFLPGVVIHELSHFLVAALLAVPTGEVSIFPKIDEDSPLSGERVALGSVHVAKTDFLRASLIGAAPLISGSILLYVLVQLYFAPFLTFAGLLGLVNVLTSQLSLWQQPTTYLVLYVLLCITNTMFSSKEDARAWPILVVIVGVIGFLLYMSGYAETVLGILSPHVTRFSRALSQTFAFAVVVDSGLSIFLFALEKLLERLTRRRIVYGARR